MKTYNDGIEAAASLMQQLAGNAQKSPHHSDLIQLFKDLTEEVRKLRIEDDIKPTGTPTGQKASKLFQPE